MKKKRIIAWLMTLCMLFSVTIPARAADETSNASPYGITSTDGENAITVVQLDEGSTELNNIKKEATPLGYGYRIISMDESGWVPVPGETESGYCRSPFTLTSEKSIAAFTMEVPELNEYEKIWKEALNLGFVLAVEDNISGYVAFYPPKEETNNTLTFEIPVRKEGVTCAVLLTPGVTAQQYPSLEANNLETEDDPNDVATHHYTWNFTIDTGDKKVSAFSYMIGQSSIQILSPEGIAVVADSVKLESDFFEEIDPASIQQDETTGLYTIPLTVKKEYIKDYGGSLGQNITDKGTEAAEKPMTFSFGIDISSSVSPGEFLISTKLTVPLPEGGGTGAPLAANAPLIVGNVVAFVGITPADMTIYEGGTAGYEGVVGEDGAPIESSSSFPEPLFKIDLPKSIEGDPTALVFTNNTTKKSWNVVKAGEDSDGTVYYRLVNTDDPGNPVRVQFIDGEGNVTESTDVDLTDEVYDTYDIAIFSSKNDDVEATVNGADNPYDVSRNLGTLTVRAVEKETGAITAIVDAAPDTKLDANTATAVEPAGTTYYLNDTEVALPEGHGASLLFDDIIESDGVERVDALESAVDEKLGAADGTRHYEAKYLDLVDANNGNAWISSSAGTDIYWGYPADTNQDTEFTLVHFKDLHREGTNSGFEIGDIDSENADVLTTENNRIENTDYGIKFHVDKGGFSPFVLVWETASTPDTYTITATAGNGGSISPSGSVTVTEGADQTFAITPNSGYSIADVTVDGASVGARNTYTFEDVAANHTINATFTYNGGGTITPDPDPDPEPTPDPDEPGIADPDDTGVADWLNTKDHDVFLNGYPDGSFGPDRSMTRAEVAAMFSNLLLDKNVPITTSFSDVAEDAWYADAVNMLASLDMIAGYEDGTFRPDAPITRAEFTAIAMRFADAVPEGENIFSDVHAGDWFYDVVVGSIQYGWIGGYEDGTFRPQNTITRAEVTAITNRMLGRVADEAFIDAADALRSFGDLSDAHWAYYSIMEATNAHDYTTTDGVEEWEALH